MDSSKTLILLMGKKTENRARTRKWKQKLILIHVVIKVCLCFRIVPCVLQN
jgi:hypothetical protein